MSIYASTFVVDADHHADGCKKLRKVRGTERVYQISDKRPCTCKAGPLVYQASHILPSDDDTRGGCFDLGAIPGFIEREGHPPLSDDEDWPYWPWLRVSVNAETVVLTREQVKGLHETLGFWLEHTDR